MRSPRCFPAILLLLSLLLLGACGQQEDPEPTPSSPSESQASLPDNPGGLYLTDFLDMTVADVTDQWGEDIHYLDGWYWGASKFFTYEDDRLPYNFSFLDSARKGTADGGEPLSTVTYLRQRGTITMAAPDLPVDATYEDLTALGLTAPLETEVSPYDEFHQGASAYVDWDYSDEIGVTFLWLEGSDPHTDPADTVTVLRLDLRQEITQPSTGDAADEPSDTGTTAVPDPVPDGIGGAPQGFTGVMGCRFFVPQGFTQDKARPAVGYLYQFSNLDYGITVSVSECALLALPTTPEEEYFNALASSSAQVTYSFQEEGHYVLSGRSGTEIFYQAVYYDDVNRCEVYFRYPQENSAACDPIVEDFMASFTPM